MPGPQWKMRETCRRMGGKAWKFTRVEDCQINKEKKHENGIWNEKTIIASEGGKYLCASIAIHYLCLFTPHTDNNPPLPPERLGGGALYEVNLELKTSQLSFHAQQRAIPACRNIFGACCSLSIMTCYIHPGLQLALRGWKDCRWSLKRTRKSPSPVDYMPTLGAQTFKSRVEKQPTAFRVGV